MSVGRAQITKPAPDFEATAVFPDGDFKKFKLSDYRGKYMVLFSYPFDFTFVCPTEIIAFSEMSDKFRKINCEVAAFSCDSRFSHLAWMNQPRKEGGLGEMKIPLIEDFDKKIASDYGVLIPDGDDAGATFRGLFIIDDKGVLRSVMINDCPVGRNPEEVFRLVQAFQYTDEHGEVCPASWRPGAKTIKPDPAGSKTFFASGGAGGGGSA